MKKYSKKQTHSSRNIQKYKYQIIKQILVLTGLLFLMISIPFFIRLTLQPQRIDQSKAATCNDSGCTNVYIANYKMYQITNCNVPNDPDGDQQLCNIKGRIGYCRNQSYCCPSIGGKWTQTMTACITPTSVPTQIIVSTSSPTSIPTITNKPQNTATPSPIVRYACNGVCTTNTNCQNGLVCASFTNGSRKCRKSSCLSSSSCVCPTNTPTPYATSTPIISLTPSLTPYPTYFYSSSDFLFTTPTPTMDPTPAQLSVNTFTDSHQQTKPMFTLSGNATPYSQVDISIPESKFFYSTTADAKGYWRYIITKPLSKGKNTLSLTASLPNGTKAEIKESFTVVPKRPLSFLAIIGILSLLGIAGYVFYRQNQ